MNQIFDHLCFYLLTCIFNLHEVTFVLYGMQWTSFDKCSVTAREQNVSITPDFPVPPLCGQALVLPPAPGKPWSLLCPFPVNGIVEHATFGSGL